MKNDTATVFFLDPVHQTHNNENSYCWQLAGKSSTKQVLSNSGRRRINIVGALEAKNLKPTVIMTEYNCDTSVIAATLEEIRKQYPKSTHKKIVIFLDNAPYNRAYDTMGYAEKLDITLCYLPPYSPNLNLIERLWKFFKKKVIKNKYYETFEDIWNAIIRFFQHWDHYLPELKSLLTPNFEIIS